MRFGRVWLLAAVALLAGIAFVPLAPTAALADSQYNTNCPVNLRMSPSISAPTVATLQTGTVVAASGTVPGDAWSASCPGSVSGSTWFSITAVNGTPVSSLYGVGEVYAASGLFRAGGYLEGIDVSYWQHTINWPAVAAAGKRFAVMRASYGQVSDTTYPANKAGARAAGVAVAAYHYAYPNTSAGDAVNEANWFVQAAGLTTGDLIPALDIEESGGLAPAALQAWVQSWLDRVYALTGVRAMIYTSPSFWQSGLANTAMFANQGYSILWVAHWGTQNPIVPGGNWGGRGWTFWQYDNCGSVPGISGCVDLDRYNGLDLRPVTVASVIAPPTPLATPPPPPPAPVLSSLAPSTTGAGGGDLKLTLSGANFVSGASTAYWNGMPLPTTYVSTSQLSATVPAAMTASPATATVMVVNAATGAWSGPATFTVTLPPARLVTLASSSVISTGQSVTIRVAMAPVAPNRPVTLQSLPANATAWSNLAAQTTDASGTVTFTAWPSVNTQYRAVFAGAPDLAAGTSAPATVSVRSSIVLRPTSLGKVKSLPYLSRVTFTGTARPIGAGIAQQKVVFSFYRYIGGKWVYFTRREAWTDSLGRASYTWTFNWRGQWYVRAVANATSTNAQSIASQVERYSIY